MKIPPHLERMMFGFIESQVLFTCDHIGLLDYLVQQDGANAAQAAHALNYSQNALERLLICALASGLLDKKDDTYRLKPDFMPFLCRTAPHYFGGRFSHYWKTTYEMFRYLTDALRENKPQWNKLPAQEDNTDDLTSVYENAIYSNDQATKEFLETMWASGYQDSQELCSRYSFAGYHKMIDLGGATGSFSIAALEENPKLEAVIMDLPNVKSHAEAQFRAHGMSQRAAFYAGNIFKDSFPCGDIYVLGYVLSDWRDSDCLTVIQRIYHSLPQNGLIVILEKLLDPDKSGPYVAAMLNLTMLMETYGTLKCADDYTKWLYQTGFSDVTLVRSAGEKHMIVGKKCAIP